MEFLGTWESIYNPNFNSVEFDGFRKNAINYLHKMSKKELIEEIVYIFDYAPEWIYTDLVRRNDIEG